MRNWLLSRLTPAKRQEPRWAELAQALETVWQEFLDPALSRVERLRSAYSADDADLSVLMRQMGDYLAFDLPKKEDRPIAVAWRRLELNYKDMESLLQSVFRRHYGDLPVAWLPLFAPCDKPYGHEFVPADGPLPNVKNIPPDGYFLTSRGLLAVDHSRLLKLGLRKQDFLERSAPIVQKAKPLHIVYGGPLWHSRFDIFAEFMARCFWDREHWGYELQFAPFGSRFDHTSADMAFLDIETTLCKWEREQFYPEINAFPPFLAWRLDMFLPEGFPEGWLPLDVIVAGNESQCHNPAALAAIVREDSYDLPCAPESRQEFAREVSVWHGADFEAMANCASETNNFMRLPIKERHGLDVCPRFDECPADFAPLDMAVGGLNA